MSIYFENETGKTFDFDYEEVLTSVIKKSLDYVKCPYECCVNVTLVHSDEIREINKTQRDVDDVTDVLSFPMIDYEVAGDFDFLRDKGVDYFDPDSGELLLGDIVICVEKIESQAKDFGHGEKREVAFLTAHSMFHLFGYDHVEDEERKNMEMMQEEVLWELGITRNKA